MATAVSEMKRQGAVSVKDMAPKDQVKHLLEQNKTAIASAIPRHMNAERLMKVAQTAITTTPALLECYVPTLLGGIVQCAQMGLEPNTVLGHAYLVPFFNNKKNRKDAQVIIGYKGLIDLARRSGNVTSLAAHAVRKGDTFEFEYGLTEKLRHVPAEGERGEITHFYAVAHMKDGGHAFEVMTKAQVEKIRAGTKGNKVWSDHFEEMGRKTVIRRLAKFLPLSVELATAVHQDGVVAPTLEADGTLSAEFSVLDEDAPINEEGGDAGVHSESGGAGGDQHGGASGAREGGGSGGHSGNVDGSELAAGGAASGSAEGGKGQGNAPSKVAPADVIEKIRAAKDMQALDDYVSGVDFSGYNPADQKSIHQAYQNRQEVLEAGSKPSRRAAP